MEIEKKLISKLTDPDEILQCWDSGLRGEAFADRTYGMAFEFIVKYWRDNHMEVAPTREVVIYEFPAIVLDVGVEETVVWLSEAIQKRYAAKQTQEMMVESLETLHEDPRTTLNTLWRRSYKASQIVAPRFDRSDMSENIEERRLRYQQRLDSEVVGLPYGLTEVDEHTRGLRPGELAVVSAYTKTGKSFLLAYVVSELHKRGFTPIVFTLELSKEEMEDRIDAYYSGLSYERLSNSQLSIPEMQSLQRAQERLRDSGRLHVQRPPEGDRTVIEMVGRAREAKANYILIDQLSWMDSEKRYSGEKAETMKHGDIVRELRNDISNDVAGKIPCMLAVQQGRSSQEGLKRPEMWKIANSSNIEQTMDIAFGLSQTPQMRINNSMRLDIMGSRRTRNASWLLEWQLDRESAIRVLEPIEE